MNIEIKITGSGDAKDIAKQLISIAENIRDGEHELRVIEAGICEWEDPNIMTVISEENAE